MRSHRASLLAVPAALMMFAMPSFANFLSATGTVTCTSYHLEFKGDVDHGPTGAVSWTIQYSFTLHPSSGSDLIITDTVAVPGAIGFQPFDVIVDKSFGPLTQSYTITASFAKLFVNGSFQEQLPITFSSNIVTCAVTGSCPATIGFWKHHTFPSPINNGGLTIAGVTYTPADLLNILNANGGDAIAILGRQLVGALLNKAAGATDNPVADSAILTAETLLSSNSLNLLSSSVDPNLPLGQQLLAQATILDNYNNANFHTCREP